MQSVKNSEQKQKQPVRVVFVIGVHQALPMVKIG
jgi:hypothetical protein